MQTDDYRQLLDERHTAVMDRMGEVLAGQRTTNDHLRVQNGRIATLEAKVAVLTERTESVENRKGSSMAWTTTVAAIVAAIVQGVMQALGSPK